MNRIQKIIIRKMAAGYTQPEVAQYLKKREIKPSSLSTIEKELLKLKKEFGAQTIVQLFIILIKKGQIKV